MCDHDPYPRVAREVAVRSSREIAPSVFELVVDATVDAAQADAAQAASHAIPRPVSGQFFMLRARPSAVFLGRPISVYLADESSITFLILKKGAGSAELCALRAGDSLDLVGPIGNRFIPPVELVGAGELAPVSAQTSAQTSALAGGLGSPRVAIIGGGIGVAPVAGFALGLSEKSFDFYASFRSSPYGLDGIESRATRLVVTTEDGSAGVKGMLPAVFDAAKYDLVYACGPTPMLRYVKEACDAAAQTATAAGTVGTVGKCGPRAFLSLEEHMACGAGACLGCTVMTVNGNRRCCVDGPVFEASEVLL